MKTHPFVEANYHDGSCTHLQVNITKRIYSVLSQSFLGITKVRRGTSVEIDNGLVVHFVNKYLNGYTKKKI